MCFPGSKEASYKSVVIRCNTTSGPLSPLYVVCRWTWSGTEEDLYQMGKLSLRPSHLSHWWLVHRPSRWPHAYPPSGSTIRRTAGQYHTVTSLHPAWPPTHQEKKSHVSFVFVCVCELLLLLLLHEFRVKGMSFFTAIPIWAFCFSQPRPTKGRMRIHCLENVDKALQFLKEQKVHLENMGSHDIVDGNHRLTLGLIWTIILRFQVTSVCFVDLCTFHSQSCCDVQLLSKSKFGWASHLCMNHSS